MKPVQTRKCKIYYSYCWTINLIILINKNQEGEIRVKFWKIREAVEKPQSLLSCSILGPKGLRSSLSPALPLLSSLSEVFYTSMVSLWPTPPSDSKQVLFVRKQWKYHRTYYQCSFKCDWYCSWERALRPFSGICILPSALWKLVHREEAPELSPYLISMFYIQSTQDLQQSNLAI